MTDTAPIAGATTETAGAAVDVTTATTPPPAATVPSSAQPAAPDIFAEPDASQAVFDRGYVERIRREGQRYRTEGQQAAEALANYEKVFGRYEADDRQFWLDLATAWADDPNAAARTFQQIAQAVLTPDGAVDATATPPDPTSRPGTEGASDDGLGELTPEKVQQMIAEALGAQRQQAAEQQAVDNLYAEMRAGGFEPGTPEGTLVIINANSNGGDVAAAMDAVKAYKQSIIDAYVAGKTGAQHPTPIGNGSVATDQPPVHDLRDARKAADAYIRAQIGASSG